MIVRLVAPTELTAAAAVARCVTLRSVVLVSTSCKRLAELADVDERLLKVHIDDAARVHLLTESAVSVLVTFHVRAGRVPQQRSDLFDLDVTFRVDYERTGGHAFSQSDLGAFVKVNPVYNAWPYMREFVAGVTMRMGYPALHVESLIVHPESETPNRVVPRARRRNPQ